MKTTIAVLFSVLMILPGIKKSSRQSENDVNNALLYFPSIQGMNHYDKNDLYRFPDLKVNTFGSEKLAETKWIDSEKKMEADLFIEEWMKSPENWIKKTDLEIYEDADSFILQIPDDMYQEVDPLIEKWMTEPRKWTERNQSINL